MSETQRHEQDADRGGVDSAGRDNHHLAMLPLPGFSAIWMAVVIDALIFSRDRPMQLEACIRSLTKAFEGRGRNDIHSVRALCKATTPEFAEGYLILQDKLGVQRIQMEDNFSEDATRILRDSFPYVLLLCDDALTFGKIPGGDPCEAFTDDVLCLCLRLGRNTTYCHPRDLEHGLPELEERGPFLVWDWHGPTPDGDLFDWQGKEGDFGYPYSLDGTVHRRDSLLEWIEGGSFVNPNQMEGCVVHAIGQRRDLPPMMAAYPYSVQVGLPINVVNQTHGNRFGLVYPVETAELNERFLRGERIDLDAMDFTNVRGAHQEIELKFR